MPILRLAGKAPRRRRPVNSALGVTRPSPMPIGAFRRVVLLRGYALKLPRLKYPLLGMQCNRWEREMWYRWRPVFGWNSLCPVLFADPLGMLVVMRRARQPVTLQEIIDADPDDYPDTTAEVKEENFGFLQDGSIVAVDYGVAGTDMVRERRAYYVQMHARRTQ